MLDSAEHVRYVERFETTRPLTRFCILWEHFFALRITSDRLLRELYELDLTESTDSDSSNSVDRRGFPSKKSKLFQAALDLRDAAQAEAHPPSDICMRFTRLLPHLGASELFELPDVEPSTASPSKDDQLIVAQLRRLRELGIRVKLGPSPPTPQQPIPLDPAQKPTLIPTKNINLDLSLLVALCSDITHAPLPASEDDALRRFHTLSWRQRRGMNRGSEHVDEMDTALDPDSEVSLGPPSSYLSEHARSLATQAMQESRSGLMDQIRDRCYSESFPSSSVTHFDSSARESGSCASDHRNRHRFWTTQEAKDRFLAIVDKIGGPMEKLRARTLFQKQLEADFWESSRYPMKYIPDLIPIHLFEDPSRPTGSKPPSIFDHSPSQIGTMEGTTSLERLDHQLENAFRIRLRETCLDLLSMGTSPALASIGPESQINTHTSSNAHGRAPSSPHSPTLKLIPASALKIGLSARSGITPHTLRSLLIGVGVGDTFTTMTTLTANRSSIDTALRQMKALFPAPFPSPTVPTVDAVACATPRSQTVDLGLIEVQRAVVWIVEPRSLAEGMRSDSGDVRHTTPAIGERTFPTPIRPASVTIAINGDKDVPVHI